MISIKQIDFQNFRIVGTNSLTFADPGNGYHMHGIIAENGVGKTTILNAITWCLYGEEYQLKDTSTSLSIINSKKLNEMAMNESAIVSVKLTIEDDNKELVFERRHKVIRSQTNDGTALPILDMKSDFVVVESDLSTSDSAKSYTNEDAEFRVAEYFEKSIHDFFFFDGEKLEEFFTANKASSIQTSVEAIAQISLLDAVIRNSRDISSKLSSKVSKNHPIVKRLETEMLSAKHSLDNERDQLEKHNNDLDNTQKARDDLEKIRREHSLSASYEKQKSLLEDKKTEIKEKQDALYKKMMRLAIRGMTLIHLYPAINSSLKLIEEKGSSGDYSVLLSKSQLEAIIKDALEHVTKCPICSRNLETPQIVHIQSLVSRQTVDDDTSLTLRTLKEDLIKAKEELLNFKNEYQEVLETRRRLEDEYSDVERDYNDVSANLSRLGTARDEEGNVIDFLELDNKIRNYDSNIASINRVIGATEALIRNNENTYQEKCEEYEAAVKRENEDKELQSIIDTLKFIIENLTSVKEEIAKEVRTKLEEVTKEIFMKVIKKKETFGNIRISDSYRLSLYDTYGQEMTGSSSATEYMILAYSYTLAIHETSGHNCPLVIDSPLGRISGDVRTNTAEMLLDISRSKQIIMLFTEDEYSESVKKLFNGKAALKTIILAGNEKAWEGEKA